MSSKLIVGEIRNVIGFLGATYYANRAAFPHNYPQFAYYQLCLASHIAWQVVLELQNTGFFMENGITTRKFTRSDDPGLASLLKAHMAVDSTWPPPYARDGRNLVDWLAERSDIERWVILKDRHQLIGHVGVTSVEDDEKAAVWKQTLDCPLYRLAEIGRLLVHPGYRKTGASALLTRACLRGTIERGMVPVATGLADATDSLNMMTNLGWRIAGSITGGPSNLELKILIAPQKLIAAALGTPFTPPV